MTDSTMAMPRTAAVRIERSEAEVPLLLLVILASIAIWFFLAVSIIGALYAVFLGVFFFLSHLLFIAHLRGSAIKLGADQLPELHARVQSIASRLGMEKAPDAYLMQAGGVLNALATKLFRSNFIVLYSELLEACGEDREAMDFIIGHEIGHVKAGHLRFQWFLIPGRLFPFIGTAYSRAREYTADRYGFAITGDPNAATRGLVILAAGPQQAKNVNVEVMLRQRHDMATVTMTLGRWMSTHPPIVDRVAGLDRTRAEKIVAPGAILGAAGIVALFVIAPLAGAGWGMRKLIKTANAATANAQRQQSSTAAPRRPPIVIPDVNAAAAQAASDLRQLAETAESYKKATGAYPEDESALYAAWQLAHSGAREPRDPFDKTRYGYDCEDGECEIYSAGNGTPWRRADLVVHLGPDMGTGQGKN